MEFHFGKIKFFSNFDSGNLAKVEEVKKTEENKTSDYEFKLWVHGDSYKKDLYGRCRNWFYFGVEGVPMKKKIFFHIVNMGKMGKMFGNGYTPLYKEIPRTLFRSPDADINHMTLNLKENLNHNANNDKEEEYKKINEILNNDDINNNFGWKRCNNKVTFTSTPYHVLYSNKTINNNDSDSEMSKSYNDENNDDEAPAVSSGDPPFSQNLKMAGIPLMKLKTLSFSHVFSKSPSSHVTFFCFSFPWSYKDNQIKLKKIDNIFKYCKTDDKNFSDSQIYYYRELLCYSPYNLKIDLITITNYNNINYNKRENYIDNKYLFPNKNEKRCHVFKDKKIIFLSSRVHPGETPCSHALNGSLKFLLSEKDVRAIELRKRFVFKLIPMLNPDGVKLGFTRTDKYGVNLNRTYLDPDPLLHPSIFAIKTLLVFYHVGEVIWKELLLERNKLNINYNNNYLNNNYNINNYSDNSNYNYINCNNNINSDDKNINDNIKNNLIIDDNIKLDNIIKFNYLNKNFKKNYLKSIPSSPHLSNRKLKLIKMNKSGLIFFMDYHAHPFKRGCFLFGNHFNNEKDQLDVLTYARLISINSNIFDFTGSNFNVGNMFYVDKTSGYHVIAGNKLFPGTTKEGSGRVAIFEHIGLIHCYTLECNFHRSRFVRQIPNLPGGPFAPRNFESFPHDYNVSDFYEIGEAVLVSFLDFMDLNPLSRLSNSEFKNVNHLKKYLKNNPKISKLFKKKNTRVKSGKNFNSKLEFNKKIQRNDKNQKKKISDINKNKKNKNILSDYSINDKDNNKLNKKLFIKTKNNNKIKDKNLIKNYSINSLNESKFFINEDKEIKINYQNQSNESIDSIPSNPLPLPPPPPYSSQSISNNYSNNQKKNQYLNRPLTSGHAPFSRSLSNNNKKKKKKKKNKN